MDRLSQLDSLVDVDGLQRLNRVNRCAQALFKHALRRVNNASESSADRLLAILIGEENISFKRSELIHVLKELERLGCGRFVAGRHTKPSRFMWAVPITEVGKVATGERNDGRLNPPDTESDAPDASNARYEEAAIEFIEHVFQLRPGWTVKIGLPTDLTTREAGRLADFIKTLPFDGQQ